MIGHIRQPDWVAKLAAVALAIVMGSFALAQDEDTGKVGEDLMSAMGQAALNYNDGNGDTAHIAAATRSANRALAAIGIGPKEDGPTGGQAETSIAVDSTGAHIVVGFNDTRGFSLNPVSVSGFMYSDDGGVTFTDGGQLPSPGTDLIGATRLPQVFGDPEIKYLGGSTFIYFSIMVKKFTATGTAQTMCFHRSTDFGHTWTGPFEVTSATNPHGLLSGVNARDAADKEFADVDPDTGRVLMSWSNFTSTAFAPGGVEISTTFCDNIMSATPTWSARKIVAATSADGQASLPRFAGGGSPNAYVVWRRSAAGSNQIVGYSRSTDNGANWSVATNTSPVFFTMDQVLGNDRVNTSPGMDVDKSGEIRAGYIYVAVTNNNSFDGGDIQFQRSTDGGLTFSSPVLINSRPGFDRAQWFPWVSVDKDTGRVNVFYYDQGIATSGDLTEVTAQYSDDGGVTWTAPFPVNDRPFHAGYGNDTGQPNIGDYNQAVSQGGTAFHSYAVTPLSILYTDGLPSASMDWPDAEVKKVSTARLPLRLGSVSFTDSHGDGNIDPNETVSFIMPLESYAPGYGGVTGISATLTCSTPNVTVTGGSSGYPDVGPGGTTSNTLPLKVKLSPAFVLGTPLDVKLSVTGTGGTTNLLTRINTGTPVVTTVFAQDFNGVASGLLPAGWASAHGGGNNTVPWTTSSTRFGTTSNAAFHINANDGLSGNHTRWERLLSPNFNIPAGSEYVTIEFDTAYNTEDQPGMNIWTWDGYFLRVTDFGSSAAPALLRSVLAEACTEEFTTGAINHYPKHLPRNSSTSYFEDMSCWGGTSSGFKHVKMKFRGMAGRQIQLRFEYTQDSVGTGADLRGGDSGVMLDNVVVKSYTSTYGPNTAPDADDDSYEVNQDDSLSVPADGVLGNDSDADGDSLTASLVTGVLHGSVGLSADGSFTYTPTAGYYGPDSFTYKANDGLTDSNIATVNIHVDGKPTANAGPDQTVTVSGALTPVTLSGSGSDPELGPLTFEWKEGATSLGTTSTLVVGMTPGTHTITLYVTDDHGNVGSDTVVINVVFSWSGLLQPVNQDGSSVFKLGSTIPLKFRLAGASTGLSITAKVYLAQVSGVIIGSEQEAASTSAADSGNTFRQNDDLYIFNLATKGLSVGTWRVRVDLGDGVDHSTLISLK